MTGISYYAVTDTSDSIQDASGLARRRRAKEGGFIDEALQENLSWVPTSAIVEWKRDALDFQLVEVSEEQAEAITERLREKWSSQA